MTPLSLGIFASANFTIPTSFESIATVTVGSGGAADVTFSSIPSTFTHLQLRGITRTDRAATGDQLRVQVNADTGSNYSWHRLEGDGSSANSGNGTSTTFMALPSPTGSTTTANVFGVAIIDVLDYLNTNKNKTFRGLGGWESNTEGFVQFQSGLWRNTNAITSIKIYAIGNFSQYTTFALYGIKGA